MYLSHHLMLEATLFHTWTQRSRPTPCDRVQEENTYNRIKSLVMEELKQYFRPEFSTALTIIVFRQLTKPEVKEIVTEVAHENAHKDTTFLSP
jgi:ATP-dependent Clp protease ATP-binding subunit ClpA